MATSAVITAVEQQQWLETVSAKVQPAITHTFAAGGPLGRQLKNFLHGTWLGHPLHPVLTDIPSAPGRQPSSWMVWRSPRDAQRSATVPRRRSKSG
jgi:hypothetical protein